MKKSDARKVLEIMTNADGGCSVCVEELFSIFIREYGFEEIAKEIYLKIFDYELEM